MEMIIVVSMIIAVSASFQEEPPVYMAEWAGLWEQLGHAQLHGGPEPYQYELLVQRFSRYTLHRVNRVLAL